MVRDHCGFYCADENYIQCLEEYPGEVLEAGRSCIDAAYRTGLTMQLLWRGIAAYVFENGIDWMFGCASFPGADPETLDLPLSYLYHYHLAPEGMRPRALPARYVEMNRLPKEAIDPAAGMASLPPLLKGYLRLGGVIGDGAVIDAAFNTVDVCIMVKTEQMAARYAKHFMPEAAEAGGELVSNSADS
jgi:putative hemolysin